jgi:hypothetical protein
MRAGRSAVMYFRSRAVEIYALAATKRNPALRRRYKLIAKTYERVADLVHLGKL